MYVANIIFMCYWKMFSPACPE